MVQTGLNHQIDLSYTQTVIYINGGSMEAPVDGKFGELESWRIGELAILQSPERPESPEIPENPADSGWTGETG